MGLAQEVDPDRGLVLRVERVEHEAGDQAGLADRLLAQDHQLVPGPVVVPEALFERNVRLLDDVFIAV